MKSSHSNKEEMCHIYSRVMHRPFLFEINSSFNNEQHYGKKVSKESLKSKLKKKTITKMINDK